MKYWQSSKLFIQFTLSFVLHQILLMLVLSIPGAFYIMLLNEPDNQTLIIVLSWTAVAFYILYCLFYGYFFARPMYNVLRQIEILSKGGYLFPKQAKPFLESRIYRQVNMHLQSLSGILQENAKKRTEFDQLRQEWAAGVTHDLKTPLSYISGYTDMLLSAEHSWNDRERTEFLQLIKSKSDHMEQLISDLGIAFQMDQSLDIKNKFEQVELVELLRRVIAETSSMPTDKIDTFDFIEHDETIHAKGDEALFRRAFTNLIINAVEHNPSGTTVKITIRKTDTVDITIEDNGRGIDEETLNHLFDRYYRGTSTEAPAGSTGLGMAIAKQIITAFDGTIELNSQLNHGTTFIVKFPSID
jgi:signal transduction histidine kinase